MIVQSILENRRDDSRNPSSGALDFDLPPELEAGEPPEARGLDRDEVRLLVSYRSDDRVVHSRFRDLPDFLEAGDVLVINTSGDRKSTRLNSSHANISYAVFCLK